ncbi:TonB-dependent receptor [Edaphobacter aggregans]|uniref:TonB-dependent receptor n=1 Tax=Edaphobacter aggregans TaxID=570835 RepID=UPI00055638B1|nr:TonB-dependent receptor [Edaphobacter aggregans]
MKFKIRSFPSYLLVALSALLLGFTHLSLEAQTDTGRVTGVVEDTTEASIPGATVTIENTQTSAKQTTTADGVGNFNFSALPRGQYKITATMNGFQTTTQTFDLQVSQTQTITFKLAVGSTSESIEVTSAAPIIDLGTSSVGEVVAGRQVTELPLNGRNFTQLALLTPGVTRGNYGNSASGVNGDAETFRNSSSGGGSLSTNGLRPQANNYILDGIDNNEGLVNTLDFFPNVEATEEFRVNTSTAPAEFGRAGGAIVQTSIKSGSNSYHGSAYWFARSNLFDASPNYQFLGASKTPALPFKRNTFGGTLGGPIIKDKLFLFGDYSGSRESTPLNPQIVTVPTALMRQGNFSQLLGTGATQAPSICGTPGVTTVVVNGGIYDPTTCQQFPGNIIPASRLNAAGINYLNAYPLPNIPGTLNGTQNNYRTIRRDTRKTNTIDGRLDYNVGAKDRLFARFSYDNSNFSRTSEFPTLPAGFASGTNYVHARGYALGETHTFGPNTINELRAGFNRYTFANVPVFTNLPISADLGIVNANRTAQLGGGALIGGNGSQLEYTGDYGTYLVPENTYQINDALTYTYKSHVFKFGGNAIRREVAFFRPIAGKGYFQLGNGDFTGYDVSEVLAGFSDNYSIGAQSGLFGTRNYEVGIFGQDDWKVSRRLTLNLGIRWDVITYPYEMHNRQAALDPNSPANNPTEFIAGQNGVGRSIINNRFNNFAPRIGFAYDLDGQGRTVLRGGYGLFYFLDRGGIDNQLGQQVPFGGSTAYYASKGYRIAFTGQNAPNGSLNSAQATNPLPLPTTSQLTGANVFAVNQTEKLPTVQQYDLQIQQELTPKMVMTVGYVGNIGTHLATGYNYNSKPFSTSATTPTAFPTLGQVVYNLNDGVSHYNSLQAQLNYRASKGLTLTSSYTWARNIDNTNGYLGFYAVSDLYFYDHSLNKGNSSLDQRHVFVASALYNLPFGRGQRFGSNLSRGLDYVIGGWQLNTIVQAETGTPFSVTFPVYGGGTSIRADLTGSQPIYLRSISGYYLSPAAFRMVAPAGRQGNSGRNEFFGPGIASGDVSIFKTVGITERFKTELRAEVFNVTNTPQFTNPDGNITDGTFGRITATRQASERQMQMAIRLLF